MKGKLLLNLALLAVVGVLALLAFYQPGSKKQDDQPVLTDLKADQVTRIELQREGRPATVLERNGARWRMLQPYAIDADEARVGFLLDFLGARSVSRFRAVESYLAKYELDRPHATLKLNDLRFDFGAQHPLM